MQLDESVGNANPFIKHSLRVSRSAGTPPDWDGLTKALETSKAKTCVRCGGPCWYDPNLNSFHCLNCNGWGSNIASNLDYAPPSGGWADEDALTPKPTEPCRNGHFNPGWYKPDRYWICRECGEIYRGSAYKVEIPF